MLGSNPVRDGPDKSSQSMLLLTIAVLPHRVCSSSDKDDAVAIFVPLSSSHTISGDFTAIFRPKRLTAGMSRMPNRAWDTTCRHRVAGKNYC